MASDDTAGTKPSAAPIARSEARGRPNLRPSLIIVGVLLLVVGLVVKYRWHERFFAPSVYAVRAAGGYVDLERIESDWTRALFGEAFLAKANSLSFGNESLSDRQIADLLRRFPNVAHLSLNNATPGPKAAAALARFTNLMTVDFGNSQITEEVLSSLSGNAQLQWVNLGRARIEGHAFRGLAPLVTGLLLENATMTNEQLADLAALPALNTIDLRRCPNITDDGIANLGQVSGLARLDLSETKITGVGLKNLVACSSLVTLNLSGAPLADEALAQLSALPRLETLYLYSTPITDRGLAHLQGMAGLKNLDLADTHITDGGLAVVQTLTGLIYLRLDNTAITDQALSTLSLLPKLDSLSLRNTKVSDEGIGDLMGFPSLRSISIQGTGVTRAGAESLGRQRPGLSIVSDH